MCHQSDRQKEIHQKCWNSKERCFEGGSEDFGILFACYHLIIALAKRVACKYYWNRGCVRHRKNILHSIGAVCHIHASAG
jgi:hypothetical protein